MFTGLVEEIGTVKSVKKGSDSAQITIEAEKVILDVKLGDSICTNGICLTVTNFASNYFIVDVMAETMRKTNLDSLAPGDKVNLERALRLGDRLGGHMVSGHIDGVGTISGLEKEDNATWITVSACSDILKYIIYKGPISIDGVSLTVAYVDDESRENEGDLLMAAEKASTESINFMAKYGRGLICMPIIKERLDELNIGQMVNKNTDSHKTAFTVSIDAVETTTGISAHERSCTILKVIDPNSTGNDFNKPGHIFPLEAKDGGVLRRPGHTEAAVDLASLAGLYPAGVICEIMNEDGSMARVPELMEYVKEHNLKIITIADLITFRRNKELLVERVSECNLPTKYGEFKMVGYENILNGEHHVAIVKGDISGQEPILVRVHSECLSGDVFGSLRCDCGEQLDEAMKSIESEGKGVLLYMRQEGRGIGLINKIKAYSLQEQGMDTVEANLALGFPDDMRDYGIGAQILSDLGIKKIKLMTNNPKKLSGLSGYGMEIVERIPIQMNHNEKNKHYLETKKEKLGHILKFEEEK